MKDREHEVFISYSSKNKNIADAIVADLEQHNIRCWYAPRDIYPGEDWAGTIKNAIESTKIFVLVFTDESNQSHQVTNEVTLAVNSGKIIIPFLLTGSNMNDTLLYYLSSVHWLDAVSQPLNTNIETLRKQISVLLNIDDADERKVAAAKIAIQPDGESGRTQSPGSSGSSSGLLRTGIVIGVLAAALAVCIMAFAFSRGDKQSSDAGTVAGAAGQIAEEPAAEEVKAEVEPATVEEKVGDRTAEAQPAAEPNDEEQPAAEQTAEKEETEAANAEAEASEQKESEPDSEEEEETVVMIPENAFKYKGHHYYIYNDIKTNWDAAATNCRERGGYMAVINNAKENEAVYKYMTAMGYDQAFFGLTYSPGKDAWVYLEGDTSDFRDWGCNSEGVREPNNAEGTEYHAEFDINMQDGYWNDAKFGAKTYTPKGAAYKNLYTYICEWDQ